MGAGPEPRRSAPPRSHASAQPAGRGAWRPRSVSLAAWASALEPKRRGQVGSGFGRSSPSRSSSLPGSPRSPRSDGAMPGGNAIGRAGSFHRAAYRVGPRATGCSLSGLPAIRVGSQGNAGPAARRGEVRLWGAGGSRLPERARDAISSARVSASERSPGPSTGSRRAAGWLLHPAALGGEPISGSGST